MDCVLVGDLGANPAPLAACVWALFRQRDLRVREAHLLTYDRGEANLDREFFAPGAALDQLHTRLGPEVLPRTGIIVRRVPGPGGSFLNIERDPDDGRAWNQARWENARAALRAAGEDPVVFALLGGRRRTMSAMGAVVFQFLARGRDLLVDVRVGDRRVEGSTKFFFPEQDRQHFATSKGTVEVRRVQVYLAELAVPRLRRLVPSLPEAFHAAFGQASAAVAAAPPELRLEVAKRRAFVDDVQVPLSDAEFAWYATLARARQEGVDEGWIWTADAVERLRETASALRKVSKGYWDPQHALLRALLQGKTPGDDAGLAPLRSLTRTKLLTFARGAGLRREHAALVVPTLDARRPPGAPKTAPKMSRFRLALSPDRIVFV
jgi:hypothetical protein